MHTYIGDLIPLAKYKILLKRKNNEMHKLLFEISKKTNVGFNIVWFTFL